MNHDRTLRTAEALFKSRNYSEALDLCTKILSSNPNLYEAFELRSSIRRQMGDTAGAIGDLDEVIRLMPDSSAPHFRKGRYLLSSGRPEDAVREFTKAESLDRGYFGETILFYRAEAQLRSRNYIGAIEDCDRVSKDFFERHFFGYDLRTVAEIRADALSKLDKAR